MLSQQKLAGQSFFNRIEVRPLDVFHQGDRQDVGLREVPNHRGNVLQSRGTGGTPSTLAHHQDIGSLPLAPPHPDRLELATLPEGVGELPIPNSLPVSMWS